MSQTADKPEAAEPPADPKVIEEEIVAARARLASNVDALAEEANPATLARKGIDGVKAFYIEPDGTVRSGRVAKTVAGIVGFLALRGIVRRGS